MIQNSEDWLKWRMEGLGASDAPIYFENKNGNYSKYKTKRQLFHEKVYQESPKQKNNFIQDLGHKTEEVARKIMELHLSFKSWKSLKLPSTCAVSDKKHLRASLDGFCEEEDLIWECKLCGKEKYSMVLKGLCPDDFYLQTQHQMMVTGKDSVLLTAVWLQFNNKRKPKIDYHHMQSIFIRRDPHMIEALEKSADAFWKKILNKRKELDGESKNNNNK